MANGYAVAICMIKNTTTGLNTEIFLKIYKAKSNSEALGFGINEAKKKYHNRQIGAFTVNEFNLNKPTIQLL
jgi:hypothetical protein